MRLSIVVSRRRALTQFGVNHAQVVEDEWPQRIVSSVRCNCQRPLTERRRFREATLHASNQREVVICASEVVFKRESVEDGPRRPGMLLRLRADRRCHRRAMYQPGT